MPVDAYFHGKGGSVLAGMMKRYGPEEGKRVFYATAEKRGMKPAAKRKRRQRARNAADRTGGGMKDRIRAASRMPQP